MVKVLAVFAVLVLSGCASMNTSSERAMADSATRSQWELDEAFLSAQLHIFSGNETKAAEILEAVVGDSQSNPKHKEFHMMLAKVEQGLGRFEKAHKRHQNLILQHPESERVLNAAAEFYYGMKLKPQAYDLYSKLVAMNPSYSNYWIYRGLLALELADAENAWDSFNYLITNSKDAKHLGYLYMGKLMQMTSFDKKAESQFRKCLKVEKESKECTLELAKLKRTQNNFVESKKILNQYLEKYKLRGSREVAELLVTWAMEERNFSVAEKILKKIERAFPADINLKRKLSLLMVQKGSFGEALSRMSLVLKNDRFEEEDVLNYVRVLRLNGEEEKAYEFITSSKSMLKAKEKTFFIKYEMDKMKFGEVNAAANLSEFCSRIKNSKDCLYTHAYIMWKSDDFKSAQKSLRLAIKQKGVDVEKHRYFLSQMYYESGKIKQAMNIVDSIIENNAEHSRALNFKAYYLAEEGKSLDEAEKLSLRAVALEPGNGNYLDTYGYILLKSGRAKEAVVVLQEAFEIMPDEPEVAEHLADAYKKTKDIKKAIRFYTLASNLYKGENRKRIGGKIAQIQTQRSVSSVPSSTGDDINN